MVNIEESVPDNTSPLKKLEQALKNEPIASRYRKEIDFAEAYPLIEQHLSRKVPVKVVIDMFGKAYGYVIHPPQFRKFLEAERERRAGVDDFVVCSACGQKLPTAIEVAEDMSEKEEQNHDE